MKLATQEQLDEATLKVAAMDNQELIARMLDCHYLYQDARRRMGDYEEPYHDYQFYRRELENRLFRDGLRIPHKEGQQKDE